MLVGFRQGLVRAPANFLMKNGTAVSLQVPPSDTVIVTIADGNSNYLISEKHTIVNAWTGPYASNTNYWLYWDIHLVTGKRTFGHTLMEPLKGPTPPANAKDGQHWFDTTSNQMKVYIHAVKRWQRVIRVFAAKLAQGGVFVSMSRQSPSFVGTQVGLNIPTSSGALIYDNLGGVLKKKDGTYFTTEDYALTGIAYSSQVKYASVQIRAEADAYMPPLTLVRFTDFNVVRPASNHVVDKVTYGIIETEANVGDLVNVTMDGVIRSAMWDWTSAGINAPIFVDGYGALTNVPSTPPIPVAVVVDKDAILLRPSSLFFGDNGAGNDENKAELTGTAVGDIWIPSGYKIEAADAPVTPTTLVNKAYVDSLFAQAGERLYSKLNADNIALMKGMPVYIAVGDETDMFAAISNVAASSRVLGLVVDTTVPVQMVGAVVSKGLVEQPVEAWADLTGYIGGLIAGRDYFVRADMKGGLTSTPPTARGQFVTRVGKAVSSTVLDVNIEPPIQL